MKVKGRKLDYNSPRNIFIYYGGINDQIMMIWYNDQRWIMTMSIITNDHHWKMKEKKWNKKCSLK